MDSDARRKANVLGVYSLRSQTEVQGKCVLLVDDVVTSGATLSACAKVLDGAGAKEIWCVTLAQAGKYIKKMVENPGIYRYNENWQQMCAAGTGILSPGIFVF